MLIDTDGSVKMALALTAHFLVYNRQIMRNRTVDETSQEERKRMIYTGCHLSSTKGYLAMGQEALRIGANTFAFFTRNPRGGSIKPMDEADAQALYDLIIENHFAPLVAHAPYTYNLCSDKESNRVFAKEAMTEDLRRLEYLPGNYYNFHPGSHVKQGAEEGIRMITDALNGILFSGMKTMVLLETMSGKGTEVGRNFEELRAIIDGIHLKEHIGVCLDTCHVHDGGYDIVHDLEGVLREFDDVIGLGYLKAVHINDSRNPYGSHKDRHEVIGSGTLGIDTFKAVVNDPVLSKLPMILETPQPDNDGYAAEIKMLREMETGIAI